MSIGNSPEDDRPSPIEDDRPSIGRALQQARIAAGLTVDEVSTSTRVRIPIVQAIEQDDFSRCGGDVYARGHIRTLARAVGLDPEPLVAQYDAEHGGRPAPTPAAPLFEAERIRPEPRRPNWTAAMVAAIVAVIGFVGFTLFNGGDDGGKDSQVAEGPAPEHEAQPAQADHEQARRPRSPTRPTAPSPRLPQDKVTVQAHRRGGQELDLRQGPQRQAALRRDCCSRASPRPSGRRADRSRPRQRRGDRAVRQRQGGRGRVRDRARSSGSRTPRATPRSADRAPGRTRRHRERPAGPCGRPGRGLRTK